MSNDFCLIQKSRYWSNLARSKIFNLRVNVFSAKIDVEHSSAIRASQVDPYVVVFLTRDRNQSKKKTSTLKKTTHPIWNECMFLPGLQESDVIRIELKMPAWGPMNPMLASLNFTIDEISNIISRNTENKLFTMVPGIPGVSAEICLSFAFDSPISNVHVSGDDIRLSSNFQDDVDDTQKDVYLNGYGAFASLLFYPNCSRESVTTPRGGNQVFPFDSSPRATTHVSNVVAL